MAISTFKPLGYGLAITLTDSDELTVNLCHCPLAAKFTVDGSGDSDAEGLGVRVGVAVAVGVAVPAAPMVMLYVRTTWFPADALSS